MDNEALDEDCWEYMDPKSIKRGPFSTFRMALWYDKDMLPPDLGVRHTPNMPFIPIRELFHPPLIPFRSRPRPCPSQVAISRCQFHWHYRDTKGQLQGPFTSAQMALWFEHDMLPKTLQLRRTIDEQFATIVDYFPKPLLPFHSSPVTPCWNNQEAHAMAMCINGGKALVKQASREPPIPCQKAKAAVVPSTPIVQPAQLAMGHPPAPKTKAAAKGKGGTSTPQYSLLEPPDIPDMGGGPKGKGGKGGGPIGSGGVAKPARGRQSAQAKQQQQQQQQQPDPTWGWSEPGWCGGEQAWWEWSGWNGWTATDAANNNWEKQSEWKGAVGEANGGSNSTKEKGEKGDKGAAAVQAAFGSLRWGPRLEAAELLPEANLRKVLDEGIVWEERWVSPLAVRFSQGKIHPFFHERGPISEVMLQIRSREDSNGVGFGPVRRVEPPFPPIRLLHLRQQGVLVTLDNRRLYALQRFALQEWPAPCFVKAFCVDELTPTRLRAENRKFTNRVCGLQLEVESRSNAFDTFSWVTEAAHVEAPRFCRPAAMRAADRSVSLLPALVVHSLLLPSTRSILASRWPILCYLASVLINPQRREFSSKRVLLLHVLELARPQRHARACPPLCVGYTAETVVTLSKGKSCVSSKLSISRPLKLLRTPAPLSDVQRRVLSALLPMMCLPYARSALRGSTRTWVVTLLLTWGKVAVASLRLPECS